MNLFSLNYENISRRLTETVIPDYGRLMDNTRLKHPVKTAGRGN